jgi:hypothetical protein
MQQPAAMAGLLGAPLTTAFLLPMSADSPLPNM